MLITLCIHSPQTKLQLSCLMTATMQMLRHKQLKPNHLSVSHTLTPNSALQSKTAQGVLCMVYPSVGFLTLNQVGQSY